MSEVEVSFTVRGEQKAVYDAGIALGQMEGVEVIRSELVAQKIDVEVVWDFLRSLTETEAGPDDWPQYQALLDALDESERKDKET